MSDPTVLCVMLADGRPEMVRQAVACFEAQTYRPKRLLIFDTSRNDVVRFPEVGAEYWHMWNPELQGKTIGELRNAANACVDYGEIIIHWDSDDWSGPERITDQVRRLLETGADCVGYNEMLFWREPDTWLYSNSDPRYCLGTSLCCRRLAWERRMFEATSQGEDCRWLAGVNSRAVSSLIEIGSSPETSVLRPWMIARIHSGNTSNAYNPQTMRKASEWRRAQEWDDYCREKMALA